MRPHSTCWLKVSASSALATLDGGGGACPGPAVDAGGHDLRGELQRSVWHACVLQHPAHGGRSGAPPPKV
eukprot:14367779-Alexandrium_andersonii.AAC.1